MSRTKALLAFLLGAVVGIALIGAVRYSRAEEPAVVHYHANWAIFVDGQRVDLSANRYMEDVVQCTADPAHQRPEDRVHMHTNNQDVVHVHSAGATWGHLMANIGLGIGDSYLDLIDRHLVSGEAGTLKFVLNGAPVRSIRNLLIESEDRLLISFGPESVEQVVAEQYPQVMDSAGHYNTMPDPASCAGAAQATTGSRIREAFFF